MQSLWSSGEKSKGHLTVLRKGGSALQSSQNMISSLSAPTQVKRIVYYLVGRQLNGHLDGSSTSGERFGATRHMVNNCWEDSFLTSAPFSNFLAGLVRFTEAVKERKTSRLQAGSGESSEDEDDEELQLLHFFQES